MSKKIFCKIDNSDWVNSSVSLSGKNVKILMSEQEEERSVILTPSDARKLRKQIKKALEAIEGVDEEDVPAPPPPQFNVGDKVRIVGVSNLGYDSIVAPIGSVGTVSVVDIADPSATYFVEEIWFPASSVEPA